MSDGSGRSPTPAVKAARQKREAQGGNSGRISPADAGASVVTVDLTIHVRNVSETGEQVAEVLPQSWLTELLGGREGSEIGWWAGGDAPIDLTLRHENSEIMRLVGAGSFRLKHSCVRCLQEVELPLELAFDLRVTEGEGEIFAGESFDLDPHGLGAASDDDEGEALGDDDDLVTYQGERIDLAPIIREQILLEVPMHPRCDSDGLLANGPCDWDAEGKAQAEAERWVDPRWQGLLEMKDKLKQ